MFLDIHVSTIFLILDFLLYNDNTYPSQDLSTASISENAIYFSVSTQTPVEVVLDDLQPNTRYYYRMRYRTPGKAKFQARDELTFHTQRSPGSTFTFAIQGDSHPERTHQNDPELYTHTLLNAASDNPDFYMTIGDDFGIDTLKTVTPEAIERIYLNQRRFLGLVAKSAPPFLVNGNHEQGAAYLLDGTPNNPAVWVQNVRNRYYPQPTPPTISTQAIRSQSNTLACCGIITPGPGAVRYSSSLIPTGTPWFLWITGLGAARKPKISGASPSVRLNISG